MIYKLGYITIQGQKMQVEDKDFIYSVDEIAEQRIMSVTIKSKGILEQGSVE